MLGYFTELIERRRREPGDDTISHLVAAGVADDDAGLLSDPRLRLHHGHRRQRHHDRRTSAAPSSCSPHTPTSATDWSPTPRSSRTRSRSSSGSTSPVQGLARTATRDVELHGVTIPAGRKVLLCYGAANRDPRKYGADADQLDVHRNPTQILTFGQGSHHCIGNAAARMHGQGRARGAAGPHPGVRGRLAGVTWAPGPYVRRPLTVPLAVR